MALKAKPGDIIRHKKTRETYLVMDSSSLGFIVVNLFTRIDPAPLTVILPRVQDEFESDIEMIDMSEVEAGILEDKLDLVESVQEVLFDESK